MSTNPFLFVNKRGEMYDFEIPFLPYIIYAEGKQEKIKKRFY